MDVLILLALGILLAVGGFGLCLLFAVLLSRKNPPVDGTTESLALGAATGVRVPPADVIRSDLEQFAKAIKDNYDVDPSYDAAGVEWLHRFMVSRAEDLDDDIVVGLRRLTGSYLGQCLIEVHDGEWVFEGERAFVRLAPDRDVDPFWMAESQLRYRDVYSVMTLFEAAPRIARVKVGGLYAIAEEQGGYVVVKVLAVDHIAVHLRQYSNQFDTLPDELDPATLDWSLDLEKFKSDDQKAIGIGHFPVSLDGFWDDDPMLVQVAEVEDDELDGYRTWLESA